MSFCLVGRYGRPGLGINPDLGGMTIYEAFMRRLTPDFFIHWWRRDLRRQSAAGGVQRWLTGWKNIITEAKSKVAETPTISAATTATISSTTPPSLQR